MITPFGTERDHYFMNQALAQARKAFAHNEVPIGAVVVNADGIIIGRGYNRVEALHSQLGHAEMRAAAQAGKKLGDWRLEGCWMYVTLEPCTMCIGLIHLSRVAGVVFGAASPLFGYRLDKENPLQLYKSGAAQVVEGIEAEKAAELLKQFFKNQRKKRE